MEFFKSWILPQRSLAIFKELHEFRLFINDKEHTVKTADILPETTLNKFLRQNSHLTGTKYMCLEGGCGACIVAVTAMDRIKNREVVFAVNSCLVLIYTCSDWKIHTVESIGNSEIGYHPIQKALVHFNGSQCGYCSSGMIMNMYALYESGKLTMKDVENSFGGNICRCTGYRPILAAFKSLTEDACSDVLGTYADIEDIPVCKQGQGKCQLKCARPCTKERQSHYYNIGKSRWVKVYSVNETLDAIGAANGLSFMIVGGNTATGVYKRIMNPDVFIDITSVKGLLEYNIDHNNLILGANMTLTNTMELFYLLAQEHRKFSYLKKLADHIDLIANVPVRNIGTLAGNLSIKHQHHEFPSDIFVILETAAAILTIVDTDHNEISKSVLDFQTFDMEGKLIKDITLPALDHTYFYESYKITTRAQNAHALLNAGFLIKINNNTVESARVVYGAINPNFVHATNTENYLVGKNLFDDSILQGAFRTLAAELVPNYIPPDPSPQFRKKLAISLFYKFVLSICPEDKISLRNKSGRSRLIRPVSTGAQNYETNKSMYPVTKPITKLEALAQCSGTAKYIMDMPDQPGQLFAAFVLAKAPAHSIISKVDATEALQLDGVIAYYDKDDIPGDNDFTPIEGFITFFVRPEELFCSGLVQYYFQPIGIVVATSQELAEKGADMVHVTYLEGKLKPLVNIRDILRADAKDKIIFEAKHEATSRRTDVKHVLNGTFDIYQQYHYHMETQCCIVIPVEDGLDMYPSTQSVNVVQVAAAKVLKIPMNKINVTVRRLGGAYGAKISRNSLVSTAAALAAYKLQKPVKLWMPFMTNMNAIGKRYPLSADYEVGVDDKGCIQYLNSSMYSDLGSSGGNENVSVPILNEFGNLYSRDTWNVTMYSTRTDTPTGTFARAPGTNESLASGESIMQHIATALNIDPIQVRLENFSEDEGRNVAKYIGELIKWADVDKRRQKVEEFNKANRWVKRGMAIVPMSFSLFLFGYWQSLVSIYQGDGTVAVAHAGIEMGQGINTKVAQTCAYALGITLDKISVKPTTNLTSPNASITGASITSEAVCYATLKACETLKKRMKPIQDKMKNPTWLELVQKSYREGVDLSSSSLFQPTLPDVNRYQIYGATCVETEVDILTGLYQFKRVDIIEDTGNSISPQIDIGQVEGAFVMGMGYWTTEEIVMTKEGELLTNRTWNYKPPGAKDIPIDIRVRFPKKNPNELGVLHSKATAEPPLVMSCAIPFAIRDAVASARAEADSAAEKWYHIDGPSTVENTFLNSLHDYKQYKL